MRMFIAGAPGAIGSQPVPPLGARGHEVVEMTRSAAEISVMRAFGAEPPRRVPALLAGEGPVK